jgi:hypothetical protein
MNKIQQELHFTQLITLLGSFIPFYCLHYPQINIRNIVLKCLNKIMKEGIEILSIIQNYSSECKVIVAFRA